MTQIQLQQAAVTLFARKGFAATGIRDIGAEAGLNSATLYHYAAGKEDLLVGIMTDCMTTLLGLINEVAASSADPAVQLVKFVRVHAAFGATNPLTSQVTDGGAQAVTGEARESTLALRDAFESVLERILQRGRLTEVFAIDDPRVARLAIIEMTNGIAYWFAPSGRLTVEQVQHQFSEFACRLVGVAHPDESLVGDLPRVPLLATEPARP